MQIHILLFLKGGFEMKKTDKYNILKRFSSMTGILKKGVLTILIGMIGFCYIACSSGAPKDSAPNGAGAMPMADEAYDQSYNEAEEAEKGLSEDSGSSAPEIKQQKLIKTGSVSLEVETIHEAYQSIEALTKQYRGYIFEMNEGDSGYQKYMHLTTKVDSKHFDAFMQSFGDIGRVKNSTINTQDVTREYIDTKARIETLSVQENTLRQLMSKATKIEDLLRIESELQRIRQDIESTQGQLDYLKDAVSYSTVHIDLNEKTVPTTANEKNIWDQLSFHFRDGFGYWGSVFVDLISFLIWMIPVWITLFILYKLLKKPLKKLKEKMANRKNNKL